MVSLTSKALFTVKFSANSVLKTDSIDIRRIRQKSGIGRRHFARF